MRNSNNQLPCNFEDGTRNKGSITFKLMDANDLTIIKRALVIYKALLLDEPTEALHYRSRPEDGERLKPLIDDITVRIGVANLE